KRSTKPTRLLNRPGSSLLDLSIFKAHVVKQSSQTDGIQALNPELLSTHDGNGPVKAELGSRHIPYSHAIHSEHAIGPCLCDQRVGPERTLGGREPFVPCLIVA